MDLTAASQSQSGSTSPRPATPADIPGILQLVNENLDHLLARTPEQMLSLIDTTWVIEVEGRVIGCVCLEIYSPKLCELRTLAVSSDFRRSGYGASLVAVAVAEAKKRNIPEVLTVTSSPGWFEKLNFGPCLKEKYALFYRG